MARGKGAPYGKAANGGALLDNNHNITSTEYRYGCAVDANTRVKIYGDLAKVAVFSRAIFTREKGIGMPRDTPADYDRGYTAPHGVAEQLTFKKSADLAAKYDAYRSGALPAKREPKPPRSDSKRRAMQKVFDISFANRWDWWVTLTLDPAKIERADIAAITKAARVYLSNFVQRRGGAYLMVLEWHANREGVHMHALMRGDLQVVDSGHKDRKGHKVYNVKDWRYGFSTAIRIYKQGERLAGYLTKYMLKQPEKISGRWYWSGGDIQRDVPTVYTFTDYAQAEGTQYVVEAAHMAVKYRSENLSPERSTISGKQTEKRKRG